MDNNNLLMIILAFVVGFMLQGMMKNMCGGRLVEGAGDNCGINKYFGWVPGVDTSTECKAAAALEAVAEAAEAEKKALNIKMMNRFKKCNVIPRFCSSSYGGNLMKQGWGNPCNSEECAAVYNNPENMKWFDAKLAEWGWKGHNCRDNDRTDIMIKYIHPHGNPGC
jgi:hypothetical protein